MAARPEFYGTVVFVPTHDLGVPKEESPGPWEPHHEFRSAETYYLVGEAFGKAMKSLLAGGQHDATSKMSSVGNGAAPLCAAVDNQCRQRLRWSQASLAAR